MNRRTCLDRRGWRGEGRKERGGQVYSERERKIYPGLIFIRYGAAVLKRKRERER